VHALFALVIYKGYNNITATWLQVLLTLSMDMIIDQQLSVWEMEAVMTQIKQIYRQIAVLLVLSVAWVAFVVSMY
jgi:hypothetical protein